MFESQQQHSPMMYVHNCGKIVSPAAVDLKHYKDEIGRHTPVQFRRANRFVLLSLAGACRCVQGQKIEKETAVYLTTENGNLGDTETVLDQIFHLHQFPLPYNFINTMSNTASFYVAQTMALFGPNLTFSSKQLSFERGLDLLRSDMLGGRVSQALIGGVDESCPSKYQFEAKFQQSSEGLSMVEGSSWLLVKSDAHHAVGEIHPPATFREVPRLAEWLRQLIWPRPVVVSYGILTDRRERREIAAALPSCAEFDFIAELGYHDSAVASGAVAFLERYSSSTWVHINKDLRGQFVLLVLQKY